MHIAKYTKNTQVTLAQRGFTIVELLIVIVVIAILAAISIVAYTGVQNRAHDAAVQNDLRQVGTALESWILFDGSMPAASTLSGEDRDPRWDELSVTQASYGHGNISTSGESNFLICRIGHGQEFAIVAWSRSGNGFSYANGSVGPYEYEAAPLATSCPRVDISEGRNGSGWALLNDVWRL